MPSLGDDGEKLKLKLWHLECDATQLSLRPAQAGRRASLKSIPKYEERRGAWSSAGTEIGGSWTAREYSIGKVNETRLVVGVLARVGDRRPKRCCGDRLYRISCVIRPQSLVPPGQDPPTAGLQACDIIIKEQSYCPRPERV